MVRRVVLVALMRVGGFNSDETVGERTMGMASLTTRTLENVVVVAIYVKSDENGCC